MSGDITIALIGAGASVFVGLLSFAGIYLSNSKSNADMQKKIEIAQAVTDTKIEELTREVRTHNNFAQRVPVLEEKVSNLEKKNND